MRHLLVPAVFCLVVVTASCGPLRRRGRPLAGWSGGDYIGAECNRVMCVQDESDCRGERVEATAAERVLMAICVPRKVTTRVHGSHVTDERHRFRQPDLAELHATFDDRHYKQLEAALTATIFRTSPSNRDRAYLSSVYAHLVTDEAQLARELVELGGLTPEARASFIGLVQRLRAPPMIADGADQAERYIFHEVPQEVILLRRNEFATRREQYAQLDALVAQVSQDIAMGQARPEQVSTLEALRRIYLESCGGGCTDAPFVGTATEALVQLHIALGNSEGAQTEIEMSRSRGAHQPTLAASIWAAQNAAATLLSARETEVEAMVARGMNEAVARQRVGRAGNVRLERRSVFAVPLHIPDP